MMIRDQLTRPHTVQLQMDNTQTILYSSQYVVNELRSTDSDTVQSVEYSIVTERQFSVQESSSYGVPVAYG